jgi:hypothetical protein
MAFATACALPPEPRPPATGESRLVDSTYRPAPVRPSLTAEPPRWNRVPAKFLPPLVLHPDRSPRDRTGEVEGAGKDGTGDAPPARRHDPWALGFQAGYPAQTGIDEVIQGDAPRHENDVYLALSLVRQFRPFDLLGTEFRLEGEFNQIAVLESERDHEPYGQTNVFLTLRYLGDDLPWSEDLQTTLAIGEGISYAWEIPDVEFDRNGEDDVGNILNFLMFEISAKKPASRWDFYFRLSHRSGAGGVLSPDGVVHGSNVLFLGVRYGFGG